MWVRGRDALLPLLNGFQALRPKLGICIRWLTGDGERPDLIDILYIRHPQKNSTHCSLTPNVREMEIKGDLSDSSFEGLFERSS